MKRVLILFAVFAISFGVVLAQEGNDLKVSVTNANGKRVKNVTVYLAINGDYENMVVYFSDKNADNTLRDVRPGDILDVIIYENVYEIPITESGTISLVMRDKEILEGYKNNNGQTVNTNHKVTPLVDNAAAERASFQRDITRYNSIASYLRSRVPSVKVTRNGVVIRGSVGNAPALIVVDGRPMRDFASVNAVFHPRDIESIRVLRNASRYGFRGANGAIEITTRR